VTIQARECGIVLAAQCRQRPKTAHASKYF
jgi:hypothetical protein